MSSAATQASGASSGSASQCWYGGKRRAFRILLLLHVGLEIVQPEPTQRDIGFHPGQAWLSIQPQAALAINQCIAERGNKVLCCLHRVSARTFAAYRLRLPEIRPYDSATSNSSVTKCRLSRRRGRRFQKLAGGYANLLLGHRDWVIVQ